MAVLWSPITTSIIFSGAQMVLFYLLFTKLSRTQRWRELYSFKRKSRPERTPEDDPAEKQGKFWAKRTLGVREEELLRCVGLDTYMFLRFLKFGWNVCFLPSLLAIVLLFPVYATGGNGEGQVNNYNRITLANVKASAPRLWVSLIFMYIFVGWILLLLWREWQNFLPLRFRYLAEGDADTPKAYRYSLLVENIPMGMRSSNELFKYFNNLFPGQVSSANLCFNVDHLEKLVKERQECIEKLEKAVASKHAKPEKEPMARVGGVLCCGGHKVEAQQHWEGEVRRLNGEVDEEYGRILQFCRRLEASDPHSLCQPPSAAAQVMGRLLKRQKSNSVQTAEPTHPNEQQPIHEGMEARGPDADQDFIKEWRQATSSTGFVTFDSLAAKLSAVQMELSGKPSHIETFPAPEPNDVIWENVTTPVDTQRMKRLACNALWTVGILFWAVPVAFVQAIANLATIKQKLPWLWVPPQSSFLYGLLAGYLPVIALLLLMILLPIAIKMSASKFMKLKSQSAVESYLFTWYFGFQVANLWLILIGGSFFNQVDALIDDPTSIVKLIALAVPGASQFFINILIANALGSLFLELSQLVKVIVTTIMNKIFNPAGKTQRQLRAADQPKSFSFGTAYPAIIFNLLVAFVYVPIVPIALPFAAVYFGIAYLIYRHQALFVYAQEFEGGGQLFYPLFGMIMGCLYLAEGIFFVYMGIKKGAAQTPLIIPLIVLTVLFHSLVKHKYIEPSRSLALEVAREVDKKDLGSQADLQGDLRTTNGNACDFDSQFYAQPALKKSQWETGPEPYRAEGGGYSGRPGEPAYKAHGKAAVAEEKDAGYMA